MCTVTWWRSGTDYGVLFNRDESRKRLEAEPPSTRDLGTCTYISPVDRDAGGTWIWVNQYGVTGCILNNYPRHNTSVNHPVSRGLLLTSLACLDSVAEISGAVATEQLSHYRAFIILAFDERSLGQTSWDGKTLTSQRDNDVCCPLTTSGYKPEEVISYRHDRFVQRFAQQTERSHEELAAFQSEHDPSMPAHSVLMTREDARTVSQSHVRVTGSSVSLSYYSVSEDKQLQPVITKTLSRG